MSPPGRTLRFLLIALALLIPLGARGGHEMAVYPSYYPHEITIENVPPERAAVLLREAKLHAYLGTEPRFSEAPPPSLHAIESLGSLVTVRVNPERIAGDDRGACAVADAVIRDLGGRDGVVFHPYPVTPWDGDYLYHLDQAEAEKTRVAGSAALSPPGLKVKADGLAAGLVRPEWRATGAEWDAAVEEIRVDDLIDPARTALDGWEGPPWLKAGWFRALLLLADTAGPRRAQVDTLAQRLEHGDYRSPVERLSLERQLVALLNAGCGKRVAGYTVKREWVSAEFTNGIENIGFDGIDGLNAAMFIRTVKLKNFPWNGWLSLGIDAAPRSAWNPVAGFTDRFGRLLWAAVGDPALVPAPYDAGWMLNRIADVQANPGQ